MTKDPNSSRTSRLTGNRKNFEADRDTERLIGQADRDTEMVSRSARIGPLPCPVRATHSLIVRANTTVNRPAKIGTRHYFCVPVYAVYVEEGASVDDFLEWFPGVTRQQVDAVLEYVSADLRVAVPT